MADEPLAKVPVTLEHEAALSPEEAAGLPFGQAHWWVKQDRGEFIRLGKRIRGDSPLQQIVHLEPGTYILGVGPVGSGVRKTFEVTAAEQPSPLPRASGGGRTLDGKSVVITGDLDALDRDAAKAWLISLGARVTTSVSGNTNMLLVGRDPGPKKIEKAKELGIEMVTEVELRASLGLGDAPPPQAPQTPAAPAARPAAAGPANVAKLIATLGLETPEPKVEALVGPNRFRDLGMLGDELWGICQGPRGGAYSVYIDLKDRPRFGMKCHCRYRNPCQHALALLVTAHRHFVPPVAAPPGHKEAASERYEGVWE